MLAVLGALFANASNRDSEAGGRRDDGLFRHDGRSAALDCRYH